VHVSQADLQKQLDAGNRIDAGLAASREAYLAVAPVIEAIAARQKSLADFMKQRPQPDKAQNPRAKDVAAEPQQNAQAKDAAAAPAQVPEGQDLADALKDLQKKVTLIQEGTFSAPGIGPAHRDLARISFMIQSGDAAPSQTAESALDETCSNLNKSIAAWRELAGQGFAPANALLAKYHLPALPAPQSVAIAADACLVQ